MASVQWLRHCKLTVATEQANGNDNVSAIDLSQFRVRFVIDQAVTGKPCSAEITIYNVSKSTVDSIPYPTNQEVQDKKIIVILEAGYQENNGVIFRGELYWKSVGRESETDTFMRLVAATGDTALQYSVVNASLKKGSTQKDFFELVSKQLVENGLEVSKAPQQLMMTRLPRGKTVFRMSKDALDMIASTNSINWGVGTQGLVCVSKKPVQDDNQEVVVLNANSGLIGRPRLTPSGVEIQCLLNPKIDIGTIIQINNKSIQRNSYQTNYGAFVENLPTTDAYVDADGLYQVIARQHTGDNRGNEWYTTVMCIGLDATTPINPDVYNFMDNGI